MLLRPLVINITNRTCKRPSIVPDASPLHHSILPTSFLRVARANEFCGSSAAGSAKAAEFFLIARLFAGRRSLNTPYSVPLISTGRLWPAVLPLNQTGQEPGRIRWRSLGAGRGSTARKAPGHALRRRRKSRRFSSCCGGDGDGDMMVING